MQWDDTERAGFSSSEPWLPVSNDFQSGNVALQRTESTSIYNLYRRLIRVRRERRALTRGSYRPLKATGNLLLFVRETRTERILVALNLGDDPTSVSFPSEMLSGHVLVSAFGDRDRERLRTTIDLRGNDGVVVELDKTTALP